MSSKSKLKGWERNATIAVIITAIGMGTGAVLETSTCKIRPFSTIEQGIESVVNAVNIATHEKRAAGIALSFDDTKNIDGWYDFFTREDIKNRARVTFYVSKNGLTDGEIRKLKELESMGHEIGCHGVWHHDAVEYVSKYGLESYIENEIKPVIRVIEGGGLKTPTSFAYPNGFYTPEINRELFKYFSVIRGVQYSSKRTKYKIPAWKRGERFFCAGGIWESKEGNTDFVAKYFKECVKDNVIFFWYGHGIDVSPTGNETLKRVIYLANESGLKFYTMSELK